MSSFRRRLKWVALCVFAIAGCKFILLVFVLNSSEFAKDVDLLQTTIVAPSVAWRMRDIQLWQQYIAHTPPHTASYYAFNIERSDMIGAWRALPDTRDNGCAQRAYKLPLAQHAKVSIVICFHNEARSMLLRTIISLIGRTPHSYLHELIVIDDHSEDVNLLYALVSLASRTLTQYAANVRLVRQRNVRRLGLIESRNRGATLASGDYLLFLDSHCEVNVGWLEPLLERLTLAKARGWALAVSPVLDIVEPQSLVYRASTHKLMGGFDWSLHFHWVPRNGSAARQRSVEAFSSPAFSGGTFMISRDLFFKMNAFNAHLKVWGGESIEFSIKLWLCGGQIEIVPCSRIGHIFRKQHAFHFPQINNSNSNEHNHSQGIWRKQEAVVTVVGNAQATYLRNSKIIAESWLDAHRYYYYASKPAARQIAVNISQSELTKFKALQQCRPFVWYLQHVFPQLKQSMAREYMAAGKLRNDERCLHMELSNDAGSKLYMTSCYRNDVTHWYLLHQHGQLQAHQGSCLSVVPSDVAKRKQLPYTLLLQPCQRSSSSSSSAISSQQRWLHIGPQLVHALTQLCLDNPLQDIVDVSRCRYGAKSQLFQFSLEMQKQASIT